MIGLALGALPVVVLYLYVVEPLVNRSRELTELQRVVKEVAAGANLEVRSERVLPPTNLAGLQEVPIELIVAGSIRDTVARLSQLGRTSRLLTVMDVKLRMVAVGQLLTTLTVAGYLLPAVGGD
jgi:Tfp pilus assembly protein PilO